MEETFILPSRRKSIIASPQENSPVYVHETRSHSHSDNTVAVSMDFGQGKLEPNELGDLIAAPRNMRLFLISTAGITCFSLRMAENAREPHVAWAWFIHSFVVTGVQPCTALGKSHNTSVSIPPFLCSCAFLPTAFDFPLDTDHPQNRLRTSTTFLD